MSFLSATPIPGGGWKGVWRLMVRNVRKIVNQGLLLLQMHAFRLRFQALCESRTDPLPHLLNLSRWMKFLLDFAGRLMEGWRTEVKAAFALCREIDGPYMYQQALLEDLEQIEAIRKIRQIFIPFLLLIAVRKFRRKGNQHPCGRSRHLKQLKNIRKRT